MCRPRELASAVIQASILTLDPLFLATLSFLELIEIEILSDNTHTWETLAKVTANLTKFRDRFDLVIKPCKSSVPVTRGAYRRKPFHYGRWQHQGSLGPRSEGPPEQEEKRLPQRNAST